MISSSECIYYDLPRVQSCSCLSGQGLSLEQCASMGGSDISCTLAWATHARKVAQASHHFLDAMSLRGIFTIHRWPRSVVYLLLRKHSKDMMYLWMTRAAYDLTVQGVEARPHEDAVHGVLPLRQGR